MGKTKKAIYGLIGFPLKHSFSPILHNAVFKYLNINAEYKLFEIKLKDLELFFSSLSKKNILGLNITIPYKEKVIKFVEFSPQYEYLKKIGAINTIVFKNSNLKGYNTDIEGFSLHIKEVFEPSNKKVAILGAGGASRAVAYALANLGVAEICIYDIEKEKSKKVAGVIKDFFPNFKISVANSIEELEILNKDLLINATPVGLNEQDPCLVEEKMLTKNIFVYDLIYNPPETKLLALAKKRGAKTSNGLGMLLYQAAISFKYFTDTELEIQKIFEIMNQALKNRQNVS